MLSDHYNKLWLQWGPLVVIVDKKSPLQYTGTARQIVSEKAVVKIQQQLIVKHWIAANSVHHKFIVFKEKNIYSDSSQTAIA